VVSSPIAARLPVVTAGRASTPLVLMAKVRTRKIAILLDHLDHGTTAAINQHHIIILVDEEIVAPDDDSLICG
jgi:hypothetical protein